MSEKLTEAAAGNDASPLINLKLLVIMIGSALALSLASLIVSVLLLLRPVGQKLEQGNADLRDALDQKASALEKRLDGLRDACIDWQAVLKTASEKPEATFQIIKGSDGLLALKELPPAAR